MKEFLACLFLFGIISILVGALVVMEFFDSFKRR